MLPHLFTIPLPLLIQSVGYLGVFGIVFTESGLPFGFIFPGDSLLFVAGLIASQGLFNIGLLLVLTTSAAILGDSAGYLLGKILGPRLFTGRNRFFFNERTTQKTESFYARFGVRAIVLARFIPTVRTFVPIFAGIGRMKYRTFLAYNILGGVLWGAGVTTLGYTLGHAFPELEHYLLPIIIGIMVVSTLPLIYELWNARTSTDSR